MLKIAKYVDGIIDILIGNVFGGSSSNSGWGISIHVNTFGKGMNLCLFI